MTTTTNTRTAAATTGTGDPGTTTIEDSVVAEVAGRAAAEVQGVHALGGGAARVIGAVRTAMNNPDPAKEHRSPSPTKKLRST
ncbi:Asp23/Gls24 family envelope stress response protein [Frondihabitans sp. PAMC 28766]|uniref:Asp23/Gls24 family envelope stress response protein n=1 Tax=Frondihabitans sp. PAMC 28766 TaxID=1795630 RepID=UPI000B05B002|nr:Asp23/Gls24 family envelope stress response protein [Frondihabitans sp. PAMC 28766]